MNTILTHVAGREDPPHLKWFRSLLRGRTRIALSWIFVLVLIFECRTAVHAFPNSSSIPGVVLCLIGATIRFWASGYLRKDTRVAIGGPYAWIRNPLYLGTYLMALGTALTINAWWLLGVSSVVFAVIYHFIILDEEIKLREIFGQSYVHYCSLVPRFFPRPWPAASARLAEVNPEPEYRRYNWPLSMKNKSYESYAAFAGLIGFVTLCTWLWSKS